MHPAVRDWVRTYATGHYLKVLEVGSRDINGGVRDLIDSIDYWGIDLVDGPGVDQIIDVRDCVGEYDLVLCLEVLEHSDDPHAVIDELGRVCRAGGTVIVTAAGDGREPHSAHDGGPLQAGESYANLDDSFEFVSWGRAIAFEHRDTDFRIVWRKFG